jgi:hypothetical protein
MPMLFRIELASDTLTNRWAGARQGPRRMPAGAPVSCLSFMQITVAPGSDILNRISVG